VLLRELYEAEKSATLAFGRMNPPTIGHKKLVDVVSSQPGDSFLFITHTQKPKTDPLDFQTKLKFATRFFPNVTVGDSEVNTIIKALQKLESMGYTSITYVAGSDRVDQFKELITKYNGKEYKFNNISVVSAGERDPDADGAEGMSASKMRAAAISDDFDTFKQGVVDQSLANDLYDAVRKGMGVTNTVATEDSQLDEVAFLAPLGAAAVWLLKWIAVRGAWGLLKWIIKRYGVKIAAASTVVYYADKGWDWVIEMVGAEFAQMLIDNKFNIAMAVTVIIGSVILKKYIEEKGEKLITYFEKDKEAVKESDVVVDRVSLVPYIKNLIMDYLDKEQDVEKLSKLLKMMVGREIKARGGKRYTITREDISLALSKNG